jgi:hypothetical protein
MLVPDLVEVTSSASRSTWKWADKVDLPRVKRSANSPAVMSRSRSSCRMRRRVGSLRALKILSIFVISPITE